MKNEDNYAKWVDKAEVDWASMMYLSQNRPLFNNSICLHAQQCVEKYLKALLVKNSVLFQKKHDILYLINILNQHNIILLEET